MVFLYMYDNRVIKYFYVLRGGASVMHGIILFNFYCQLLLGHTCRPVVFVYNGCWFYILSFALSTTQIAIGI